MQGVLFDLDGTLLDIDLQDFLARYFEALGVLLAGITGDRSRADDALAAVNEATYAMMLPHTGTLNSEIFFKEFERIAGFDLLAHSAELDRFYEDEFPRLRAEAMPAAGTRQALDAARIAGCRIAIATNPIFPAAAIEQRMRWAGVDPDEVDAITSFELMGATKPHPLYFRQTAAMLGLDPGECIMVGDDRVLDMAAADVGMRTYYVGPQDDAACDYRGDLIGFAELLARLGT